VTLISGYTLSQTSWIIFLKGQAGRFRRVIFECSEEFDLRLGNQRLDLHLLKELSRAEELKYSYSISIAASLRNILDKLSLQN
jgi:hypothetical protein